MNNKDDIFAPPTEQEINDLFAPPSQEEIKDIALPLKDDKLIDFSKILPEEEQALNAAKGLGLGAAQGLTFNLADELEGGVLAAKDALTGSDNDISSLYRKYQKLAEDRYKKAKESSPEFYMAGDVGGTILGGLATPALGAGKLAASSAAKVLGKNALTKALAAESASTLGNIAGKGAAMAIEAAPAGALYGAGSSEGALIGASPLEKQQLKKDILEGTLTANVVGAGLGLAGQGSKTITEKATSKAKEIAKESPYIKNIIDSFKLGQEGIDLGKQSVKSKMSQSATESTKDLVERIYKADEMLGKKVGDAIGAAQETGVKIDISDDLSNLAKQVDDYFTVNPGLLQNIDPKSKKTLGVIINREETSLTPLEIRGLMNNLDDAINNLSGINSEVANTARKLAVNLRSVTDNKLKDAIPAYKEAAKQFSEFRSSIPESIITKGLPQEYSNTMLGKLKKADEKLFKSSKELIEQAQTPGTANKDALETMTTLSDNLKKLEKVNPAALKEMGFETAQDAIEKLEKASQRQSMLKQAYGTNPQVGINTLLSGQLFGFATTGAGQGLSIANKAGQVVGSDLAKKSAALFKAPDNELKGVVNKLKQMKGGERFASALETAINNKNEGLKNAALFSILQNPELRLQLEDNSQLINENK